MKHTPLTRKTPLKARTGFKRRGVGLRRTKPATGQIGGKKVPKKRERGVKKKPQRIKALKTKLWSLCKAIIREQYGNVCYTCGKTDLSGSGWHTGHFISSSICSVALRYDLRNLRPQCYNCNINKSGNWLAFEQHLIRDGFSVDGLKAENERTKGLQYDSLWYEAKIEEYKKLVK